MRMNGWATGRERGEDKRVCERMKRETKEEGTK
jgi:hypothetical protein